MNVRNTNTLKLKKKKIVFISIISLAYVRIFVVLDLASSTVI